MRTGDLGKLQDATENKIHFQQELRSVVDIAPHAELANIRANIAHYNQQFYQLQDALEIREQLSKAKHNALQNNDQNELEYVKGVIKEQDRKTQAVIANLSHAREQVRNMIRVVRQNHTTPTPPNFRAAQVRIIDQQLHFELEESRSIRAQYEDAKAASKLATKEQEDSARSAAIESATESRALTHRVELKRLRKALEDKIAFQLALPDLIEATPVTVQALQTDIEKHAQIINQLSREVYNHREYNEGKILALHKSDEIGVTTLSEFIKHKDEQLEGIISALIKAKANVGEKMQAAKQECAAMQGARNEMVTQAPGASQPEEPSNALNSVPPGATWAWRALNSVRNTARRGLAAPGEQATDEEHRRVSRLVVEHPSGPHQGPGDPRNEGGGGETTNRNPQAPALTARDFITDYADMTETHLRLVALARANPLLVEDPQRAAATILSNQYLDLMEPSLVALAGGGNPEVAARPRTTLIAQGFSAQVCRTNCRLDS